MKRVLLIACLAGATFLVPARINAQLFAGSGTGLIPDGGPNYPADWGDPRQVTFEVSGLTAPIANISVSMDLRHSYSGDLEAVLIPPSGLNPFVIFSRIAQTFDDTLGSEATFSADDQGNIAGHYVFTDNTTGDLWAAAGFNTATGELAYIEPNIIPGSYRTIAAGPWEEGGGLFTSFALDSGFIGMSPALANGTWILQFRDGSEFDVGQVNAATLEITPVPEPAQWTLLAGVTLLGYAGCVSVRRRLRGSDPDQLLAFT